MPPDSHLATNVRELIRACLPSLDHVEVLLHVRGAASGAACVPAIVTALRTDEATVSRCLADLTLAGLVRADGASYVLQDSTSAQRGAIDALASAYEERPYELVRAVLTRPSSALRSFSDAFRFRKDP